MLFASKKPLDSSRSADWVIILVASVLFSGWVWSNFLKLPDLVSSILAVLYLAVVPFLVGDFVMSIGRTLGVRRGDDASFGRSERIVVGWSVGFLVLVLVSVLLIYLGLFWAPAVAGFALLVPLGYRLSVKLPTSGLLTLKALDVAVLPSAAAGLAVAIAIRALSPYPLQPGFDVFTHMYVAQFVLYHSSISGPLVYFPSFDLLVSLASSFSNSPLIGIFWAGPLLLFPVFSASTFLLAYQVTKSWAGSLLAAFIGTMMTEQGLVSNLQVLYPSSIVMVIFPLYLLLTVKGASRGAGLLKTLVPVLIVGIALVVIHLEAGAVAFSVCVGYLLLSKIWDRLSWPFRLLGVTGTLLGMAYYYGLLSLTFVSRIAGWGYNYNLATKINLLNGWYTPLVVVLALLGAAVLSIQNKKKSILGLLTVALLLVYFQQISSIHRIMGLVRPLLAVAASACLMLPLLVLDYKAIIKKVGSGLTLQWARQDRIRNQGLRRLVAVVYVLVLIFGLFPSISAPYSTYFHAYSDAGYGFTNFTNPELRVGNWIRANASQLAVIYSDPATAVIMRGFGDRMGLPGLVNDRTVGEGVLFSLILTDSATVHGMILSAAGPFALIVITPRTSAWVAEWQDNYFIQAPINVTTSSIILSKFQDSRYFIPLYHTGDVYVFAVTP